MRNDVEFAKRVMDIAACSSLSQRIWDDLCARTIEPLMAKIARDGNDVVIKGKSYKLDDIPENTAEELFSELDGNDAKEYLLRTYKYIALTKKYQKLLQSPPIVNNADVAKRISEGGTIEDEISNRLVPSVAFIETAEEYEGKIDSVIIRELLNVALNINAEFMSIISSSTLSVGERAKTVRDRLDMLSEEEPSTNVADLPASSASSESELKAVDEAMTPIESAEGDVAPTETINLAEDDQGLKDAEESDEESFKFVGEAASPVSENTSGVNPSSEYPRKEDMGIDSTGSAEESGDGSDESSDDDDAKSEEDVDSESFD